MKHSASKSSKSAEVGLEVPTGMADADEASRAELLEELHALRQQLKELSGDGPIPASTMQIRSSRLRALGEMAASIAHELNQPLAGVRGLAEHLLLALDRGWAQSPETIRHMLGNIIMQADRMEHIIGHIRRHASGADLDMHEPVRLNQVVKQTLEMVQTQFDARGIVIHCELSPELPEVTANVYSLEEVLLNLFINARDAIDDARSTGEHGDAGTLIIRTWLHGDGESAEIVCQVRDDGIGMEPETLERVLEPFFTTKGPDRGTGLGLPIAQAILQGFGGHLEIQSRPNRGTTISILLPVKATSTPWQSWLFQP